METSLTRSVWKVLEDLGEVHIGVEDDGDVHTYVEECGRVWKDVEDYVMWESYLDSSIVVLYILVHIMMF